ncbi:hypothetical protein Droror1_Dr00018724 [Drosera rotundifolia]
MWTTKIDDHARRQAADHARHQDADHARRQDANHARHRDADRLLLSISRGVELVRHRCLSCTAQPPSPNPAGTAISLLTPDLHACVAFLPVSLPCSRIHPQTPSLPPTLPLCPCIIAAALLFLGHGEPVPINNKAGQEPIHLGLSSFATASRCHRT